MASCLSIVIKLLCWWLFTHLVEEETNAIIMCIFSSQPERSMPMD
ncbi:acyltransferase [Xanthomonas arboricola pv. pruni]|nr:acyltransferase [Xanthomonas arboricola pv. pruni]